MNDGRLCYYGGQEAEIHHNVERWRNPRASLIACLAALLL